MLSKRPTTCAACIRHLSSTLGTSPAWTSMPSTTVSLTQVRGKKNKSKQPADAGVVVRLLQDIPTFGRKNAIFRVERGRMRNMWYPHRRAEYMTAERFVELGLTRADIGERDRVFGTHDAQASDLTFDEAGSQPPAQARQTRGLDVGHIDTKLAHALLATLVPETLVFRRKPIQPAPDASAKTSRPSPLIMESKPSPREPSDSLAIFGSVSTVDVVGEIKAMLVADTEASRIVLEPHHVRFVDAGVDADRIKRMGCWDVDISLAPPGSSTNPVRKRIEVVASPVDSAGPDSGSSPVPQVL